MENTHFVYEQIQNVILDYLKIIVYQNHQCALINEKAPRIQEQSEIKWYNTIDFIRQVEKNFLDCTMYS